MKISAINPTGFTGEKTTNKGNTYNSTSVGTVAGATAGAAIAAGLIHFQLKALKTIRGKRNLIASFHDRHKSLNDIQKKAPLRDENGKIIPLKGKTTERTKKIVREFKANLLLWGAGIIAVTTGLGKVADSNINATKAKRADERAERGL